MGRRRRAGGRLGACFDRRRGPVAAGRRTTRARLDRRRGRGGGGPANDSEPASIAAVGRRRRAGGRLGARFARRRGPAAAGRLTTRPGARFDRRPRPAAAGRRTTRGPLRSPPWAGGGGPAVDSGPASIAAVGRRRPAGGRLGPRVDRRHGPAAAGRQTTQALLRSPQWAGGDGPAGYSGPSSITAVGRRQRAGGSGAAERAGGRLGPRFDRLCGPAVAGRLTTRGPLRSPPWAGSGDLTAGLRRRLWQQPGRSYVFYVFRFD